MHKSRTKRRCFRCSFHTVQLIDNAPTDPEELERYIEAQRAAQNAGLLIGAAVAAIELLSEKLEEMKADAEDIDMDIS